MRFPARSLCLIALAALAVLPAAASAADRPQDVQASILKAAQGQRSVHIVGSLPSSLGSVTITIDAGLHAGVQQVTFAGKVAGKITVVVSGDTAYFRGNAAVLRSYMSFSKASAAKYASKWIRVPKTDAAYAAIAQDVTLPSLLADLPVTGTLAAAPATTIHGQRLVGVQGTTRSKTGHTTVQRLYVPASGARLPVYEAIGGSISTFSHWNTPLHITVPSSTVAVSATGLESAGSASACGCAA